MGAVSRSPNAASENGLSFDVYGRECDLVTPRSASKSATGFERIEEPRSACNVSRPLSTPPETRSGFWRWPASSASPSACASSPPWSPSSAAAPPLLCARAGLGELTRFMTEIRRKPLSRIRLFGRTVARLAGGGEGAGAATAAFGPGLQILNGGRVPALRPRDRASRRLCRRRWGAASAMKRAILRSRARPASSRWISRPPRPQSVKGPAWALIVPQGPGRND